MSADPASDGHAVPLRACVPGAERKTPPALVRASRSQLASARGVRFAMLLPTLLSVPVRALRVSIAAGVAWTVLTAAPAPELTRKLDALFGRWDRSDAPGVIVGVALDGETIHAKGYGLANLEHAIPLRADTVTESGSVAKQFTAAAVALLHVRGQLSLDDPLRKHLPELSERLAGRITVRMLLNHTSGLRDIHGLFDLMGRPSYSAEHDAAEVLRVFSRQRDTNFVPGSEYLYCNGSYALVPTIVARVSGKSFAAFCAAELFGPLGMAATRWRDPFTAVVRGRATGYAPRPGGHAIDLPYSNLIGNGGLLTTVGDLLKWTASFAGPAGEWAEVVRLLRTPSRLNDGRVLDYGLGLTVETLPGGLLELSHGGATSGFRTYLATIPEKRFSVALLANTADFEGGGLARSVAQAVLDLPRAPRPPVSEVPAGDLSVYAGLYHSPVTDARLPIAVRGTALTFGGAEMRAIGPRKFAGGGGRTVAEFSEESPRRVTVTTTNAVTTYVAVQAARPDAAALAAYAGTYYSEELDTARDVVERDGALWVENWPAVPVRATPTIADGFNFGRAWHATFTRDASGRVDGVELTNGRCRRVRFVRR